jgi:hypothetical protein
VDVNQPNDLSWFESVRLGGWRGGKFSRREVQLALDALDRNILGDVRRRSAQARVEFEWSRLAAQREHSVADLAALVRLVGRLDPARVGRVAFVDVELDASSRIREIGVVIGIDGVWHRGLGDASHFGALGALLGGRVVVAHNGHEHDFPRLHSAGVRADFVELDSLQLAWVAWPTLPSHSLSALATKFVPGYDISTAHRADVDADVLASLWTILQHTLATMSDWSKAEVRFAVEASVPPMDLDWLVPPPSAAPVAPPSLWLADPGTEPTANRVIAGRGDRSAPAGAAVVVDDLRSSLHAIPGAGLVARASRVLDAQRLGEVGDPWARAVGWRLLDVGRGLVDLAPLPLVEPLSAACTTGSGPVLWPGAPVLVDRLTVAAGDVARPIVVDGLWRLLSDVRTSVRVVVPLSSDGAESTDIDALPADERERVVAEIVAATSSGPLRRLAEAGVGRLVAVDGGVEWFVPFPDPAELSHGLVLFTDGPTGGDRSARLWDSLLGTGVDVSGPTSIDVQWRVLDDVPTSRRRPGQAVAALLGVAAAWLRDGRSAVVVANRAGRSAVLAAAPSAFVARTGSRLLRPPAWPTVDEAHRRLDVPSVALVGAGVARRLDKASRIVLATGPITTDLRHPAVARAIRATRDDAYDALVEPLHAHLTAEFLAAMDADVVVADAGPELAAISALVGHPTRSSLHSTESDDELAARVTPVAEAHRTLSDECLRLAERRLLRGTAELRDFQRALIADVADGRDALGIFRTGLGKSLCYQVPAVAHAQEGALTVVVSPLLSLQRDQVASMRTREIHEVTLYNSDLPGSTRAAIRRGVRAGFYRIVMLAPEALHSPATIRLLADDEVALLVVDEAHCISEMGHNFRPDYRALPVAIRRMLGVPQDRPLPPVDERMAILALTGTASPSVREDIVGALS